MCQNDLRNRIDRLCLLNPEKGFVLRPVATTVLPEEVEYEDNVIPLRQCAFPSDHAALLIELEIMEIE